MEKIVITRFSDPMMGLAWECEPMVAAVEERYGELIEVRDVMGVLVRNVADFMTPEERALPEAEGIERYNTRLAQIYLSEQEIGGVPINMEGFSLFAPGRRSSEPLCLAYEAAKLAAPEIARTFLHLLRKATVFECRPTTMVDEIMRIVGLCGIDEDAFAECFVGGAARAALEQDEKFRSRLGIWQLPAFLVSCGDSRILLPGVPAPGVLLQVVDGMVRRAGNDRR